MCEFAVNPERASIIANRRRGIGCDQLIIMRPSTTADVFMEIWNADGSRVGACGNATRCIGKLILSETGQQQITIETDAGILTAETAENGIRVNMGLARLNWDEIPLAHESPTDTIVHSFGTNTGTHGTDVGTLGTPGCVNMGNPHAVFFVDDVESVALSTFGPELEHDALFPERANVSVAELLDGNIIRLRVWERGAGITEACGTAACASVVAATRRGLIDRKATVRLDGGDLLVEWLADGTVQMAGPAELVYTGECSL